MSKKLRRFEFSALLGMILLVAVPSLAQNDGKAAGEVMESPCEASIRGLAEAYERDARTRAAFQAVYDGLAPLPYGYYYDGARENPWKKAGDGAGLARAVGEFYRQVCTLLPAIIGSNDNALDSIQYFAWFYFHNQAGERLVAGIDPLDPSQPLDSVKHFLIEFNREYKHYMDSPDSTGKVAEWIADPRLEIEDYVYQNPADYPSWNAFFARNLKSVDGRYPSRPVTMPERDYVVVSPTDCIMNPLVQPVVTASGEVTRALIENPLQKDTVLDVKGIPISVDDLLAGAPDELKAKFEGGSGLACVLMPNTYHHFHSPVDGVIRYAEIVEAGAGDPYAYGTFGYSDWPNWVPLDGNVGRPGTDFSQFQGFQRGVIIIEVAYDNLPGRQPKKLKGWVASIPVGLDTVGSLVFHKGVKKDARVTKGVTPFGNFYFGGSLNILLFSPIQGTDAQMLSPAVQTRMGNQIGILNTPYPAPPTPWTPDSGRSRDRKVRKHR
ncbi:MAG: phosphatidylserine decarboxylase [Acidobacteriota bacterium]